MEHNLWIYLLVNFIQPWAELSDLICRHFQVGLQLHLLFLQRLDLLQHVRELHVSYNPGKNVQICQVATLPYSITTYYINAQEMAWLPFGLTKLLLDLNCTMLDQLPITFVTELLISIIVN